jgi:hypothetical protein
MLEDAISSNAGTLSDQDEQMIKDLAGQLCLGGAGFTVFSVMSFFLAMVVFP